MALRRARTFGASQTRCRKLQSHLRDFVGSYNFARRLKTLSGLAPYPTGTSAIVRHTQRPDTNADSSPVRYARHSHSLYFREIEAKMLGQQNSQR
jgi:hypothetical protein